MTGWLIDRLNARILQLCLDLSLTLKSIAFAKNLSPIILFLFCSFSTVLFFFHVSNTDLKNMKCIQGNLICDIKGETSLFCSSLIKLTFLLQIKKSLPFNNFVLCTLPTPSTIRTQLLRDIIVDWNLSYARHKIPNLDKNQYDDNPNKYFRYLSRSILRLWSLSSQCVWTAFTCW